MFQPTSAPCHAPARSVSLTCWPTRSTHLLHSGLWTAAIRRTKRQANSPTWSLPLRRDGTRATSRVRGGVLSGAYAGVNAVWSRCTERSRAAPVRRTPLHLPRPPAGRPARTSPARNARLQRALRLVSSAMSANVPGLAQRSPAEGSQDRLCERLKDTNAGDDAVRQRRCATNRGPKIGPRRMTFHPLGLRG